MTSILKVSAIQDPTNSNTALSIDSSGQVALPNIPYARVNVNTATTVTPPATVPFDTVLGSNGIVWNTTNYTFTVPITGLYNFSGAVRFNADRLFAYWGVVEDATTTYVQDAKLILATGEASAGLTTPIGSCLLPLTAGTDYSILCQDSLLAAVAIGGGQTWMDIHLVG